jgi:hypothetical protein
MQYNVRIQIWDNTEKVWKRDRERDSSIKEGPCPARALKNGTTQLNPATWMMLPLARPRAGYAPFTLQLYNTQLRSYTIQVCYETFIEIATVING